MKRFLMTLALAALAACASPSTLPEESRPASPNLVAPVPVTYAGTCAKVNYTTASCDIQFYGDADVGTASVYYPAVTSWTMVSNADLAKDKASFKFKARYRDIWGNVGPWSQTINWTYRPSTGATTFGAPYGPVTPGAPPAAKLSAVLVP